MFIRSSCIYVLAAMVLSAVTAGCQRAANEPRSYKKKAVAEQAEPPVLALGGIEEVSFYRGEGVELTLTVGGGQYALLSERIQGEQLEGNRYEFESVAGIHGRLTCVNASCTETEVQLRRDQGIATIHTKTVNLRTEMGQVRDGCEVPLFFAEDFEALVRDYPSIERKMDAVRAVREITASIFSVSGWEGERFENLVIEGRDVFAKVRENPEYSVLEPQLTSWGLENAVLKVHRSLPGDLTSISALSFEVNEPGVGELSDISKSVCIDLNVFPAL